MSDYNADVKAQVREFYDAIGWTQVGDGVYQNARYEDLRPVSQEYIQRCHERVSRFLPRKGTYILDAGSGPIQYPAYLAYSEGFLKRVCLDISHRALVEARTRLGERGWYVVGDAARLPFRGEAFDALLSMHTIHHLPPGEQVDAYHAFLRVLQPGATAVVINSWGPHSPLMRLVAPFIQLNFALIRVYRRLRGTSKEQPRIAGGERDQTGTHVYRYGYGWLKENLSDLPDLEVRSWRSVSTSFLRAMIHRRLFGRFWLNVLYRIEEAFPHWMGRNGQYALVRFQKPDSSSNKGSDA